MELLELLGTLDGMVSPDPKERLKAEYEQVRIRAETLESIVSSGGSDAPGTCRVPKEILEKQLYYMWGYLRQLQIRAKLEGVDVDGEVRN